MRERPAVSHIQRSPIPWRIVPELTECGRDTSEYSKVLSVQQARDLVARLGIERASLQLCMTCADRWGWDRRDRAWPTWDENPIERFKREINKTVPRPELTDELRALESLVASHREEFADIYHALRDGNLVSFGDAKRARGGHR